MTQPPGIMPYHPVGRHAAPIPNPLQAQIPDELTDSYPAQQRWRAKVRRLTGIPVPPDQQELKHRKSMRSQLKRQHHQNMEEAHLSARIRRDKTRTIYQGQNTCGFLSVLSEKGGVGKTTISSLLSMSIARERNPEDIAVVDLNPDRGSLADRMSVQAPYSLRDLMNNQHAVAKGVYNPKQFMSRSPNSNVWVLAGDTSPERRESTSAEDVRAIYQMFAYEFSIAVLDNGTGISHSAMMGNLSVSHGTVLVVENTNDSYKFIDSTLERLENLGYTDLRSRVVLVVNEKVFLPPELVADTVNSKFTVVTGADISNAYRSKVRNVIVVPFDPALARSGPILYDSLMPETVFQIKKLAAALMDNLMVER